MSDQTPPQDAPPPSNRSKWPGRVIILIFGALLLVYFVPMFWGLLFPSKN